MNRFTSVLTEVFDTSLLQLRWHPCSSFAPPLPVSSLHCHRHWSCFLDQILDGRPVTIISHSSCEQPPAQFKQRPERWPDLPSQREVPCNIPLIL